MDVGTIAQSRYGQALNEEAGSRRVHLPTERLVMGARRAQQSINEVMTGAYDSMEGAMVEGMESFMGIDRIETGPLNAKRLRAGREAMAREEGSEAQEARAGLTGIDRELSGMQTQPQQQITALEEQLSGLRDEPPVMGSFNEMRAHQESMAGIEGRLKNLRQLQAEGTDEELYTPEQLARRAELRTERGALEATAPDQEAALAGQARRLDEEIAAIRPGVEGEIADLDKQREDLQSKLYEGGFREMASRHQQIAALDEKRNEAYERLGTEGLTPEQTSQHAELLKKRRGIEGQQRAARQGYGMDALQRMTEAGFLAGINGRTDDRERIEAMIDNGSISEDTLSQADEQFQMAIGHGAGTQMMSREDAGRVLDLASREEAGMDVSAQRSRMERGLAERYGRDNSRTFFQEYDTDMASDDSQMKQRVGKLRAISEEIDNASQDARTLQDLFTGDHRMVGEDARLAHRSH